MGKRILKAYVPLFAYKDARAKKVSPLQRILARAFGAPNARRANGIVYSGLDPFGAFWRIAEKITGKPRGVPVFEIDRVGTLYEESLPRIWLSEELTNVSPKREKGRIFVECYPTSPDRGGDKALELGDRYLGEGFRQARLNDEETSIECFQAAEILYMHAVRRGNREAANRLREMYVDDLCKGGWYRPYIYDHARHAPDGKSMWMTPIRVHAKRASIP